jgi:hypothetical protein
VKILGFKPPKAAAKMELRALFNCPGLDVDGMARALKEPPALCVNINYDAVFNKVPPSSTGHPFEFDNVALAVNPIQLPKRDFSRTGNFGPSWQWACLQGSPSGVELYEQMT